MKKYSLDYQSHLLKNSQIVLTTLDCCSSSLLKTAFGSNSETPFSCCIIDEAAQCTDIELLQILSLSFDKLIMVGDPFELPPTVHSKIAEEHYYGISMFQRFLLNFFQNQDPSFTLYEQYRMHSEICSFPSRYIYDNLLTTAPEVDLKYEKISHLSVYDFSHNRL
ncbi:probable helicase senataxin [Caerostris extrusa]|uniref:Probable helicase senataxin n=1 Tax=Caerostris extrusa TaxID=172846 RepID=A0AAV4V2X9_CAEEX|nr:probable helicase senataxin [Caerostris extrusa]